MVPAPQKKRGPNSRIKQFHQRYLPYNFKGKTHRLPMVHVRVVSPPESFKSMALVDTGATTTFIPTEMGEILDLECIEESEAGGASGDFPTHICKVFSIEILDNENKLMCNMKNLTVMVPQNPGGIDHVILGRDYIFKVYDITFRERKQRVVFK